jgi:hypothetical protein
MKIFHRDGKDGEIAWKSSQTINWGDAHSFFAGKIPPDLFLHAERGINFFFLSQS